MSYLTLQKKKNHQMLGGFYSLNMALSLYAMTGWSYLVIDGPTRIKYGAVE